MIIQATEKFIKYARARDVSVGHYEQQSGSGHVIVVIIDDYARAILGLGSTDGSDVAPAEGILTNGILGPIAQVSRRRIPAA